MRQVKIHQAVQILRAVKQCKIKLSLCVHSEFLHYHIQLLIAFKKVFRFLNVPYHQKENIFGFLTIYEPKKSDQKLKSNKKLTMW